MQLVIVESPAKAKTINKYLGSDYKVIASYGHIRDLPSKDGSVKPDQDFAMTYEISADAVKNVKAMVDAAKQADALLLATDPDREGEAISWHILEALREKKALRGDLKIGRVVFNEITKRAVTEAMKNPRNVDMDLVNAQQARRALDYLVGFTLSPILWRKLPGSRSAGRVQSVALRLICERETEIEAFKSQEYWTVAAEFAKQEGNLFSATLSTLDGTKLDKFAIPNEADATRIVERLRGKTYQVTSVERKEVRRHPAAPFTTSTLQQEAARKLGFSAKRTMQIAQRLYEGVDVGGETVGLITYMRTDGVQVAQEAITEARQVIGKLYGNEYVPDAQRVYQTKAKNAQEAHEAIRPTDPGRLPDHVKQALDSDMAALYTLIWKRLIASQMESAVLDQVSVDVSATDGSAVFRATGSTVKFDGFFALYREGKDDEQDEESQKKLPPLAKDEALNLKTITPAQHFTEPPPRYTEASLVKKMEELGIGRPSTYASIISVLQDREYVVLDKKRFLPEERGRLVTAFLVSFFSRYVSYDFTAHLEEELDEISAGEREWKQVLRAFWQEFHPAAEDVGKLDMTQLIAKLDEAMEPVLFPGEGIAEEKRRCHTCGTGRLGLKIGKFGAFLGCSNYPDCKHTRPLISEEPAEGGEGAASAEPRVLGENEEGLAISLRKGPYGYYVQAGEPEGKIKPKRASLPPEIDPAALNLEQGLALLSLPRDVGIHPESGKPVKAGIGRFGPYVQHEKTYASLPKGESVLTIGINRAVDLLAEKAAKKGGRGRGAAPLRTLGAHPDTAEEIALYEGKYGPYIKYQKSNFTIPKDADINTFSLEDAVELTANGPKPKSKRKRK